MKNATRPNDDIKIHAALKEYLSIRLPIIVDQRELTPKPKVK